MPVAAIENRLDALLGSAPAVSLSKDARLFVLSDLHLGNGSPRDDFLPNGALTVTVLREHYLAKGYGLILNGDIEELQRYKLHDIRERWAELYQLFGRFRATTSLYKIVGNHDELLWKCDGEGLLEAIRLLSGDDTLLVFHGHQATIYFENFNWLSGFFLKYFANTLRIRNVPVTYESRKKFWTEHRVYDFASAHKIVSIIGHTHRPLFESLSKIDTVRYRIEQLVRDYLDATGEARVGIETAIGEYREELERLWERDREDGLRSSLYNDQICIPCLFNSGCAIGRHGITGIEIADGKIALVHWFDRARGIRGPMAAEGQPQRLGQTSYYRAVIKQDRLEYIFSRIRLLA